MLRGCNTLGLMNSFGLRGRASRMRTSAWERATWGTKRTCVGRSGLLRELKWRNRDFAHGTLGCRLDRGVAGCGGMFRRVHQAASLLLARGRCYGLRRLFRGRGKNYASGARRTEKNTESSTMSTPEIGTYFFLLREGFDRVFLRGLDGGNGLEDSLPPSDWFSSP